MAEKKNKQLLEKDISYWTKHQELDKFNYNININQINTRIIFFGAFFIPLMLSGISSIINKNYSDGFPILVVSTVLFPFLLWILGRENKKGLNNAEESFRIREAMLRVFYKDAGVNTDLLDQQFEEIKKEHHNKDSNNELERIAKEKMKR